MKIAMIMVMAGAAIVFAAPVANAHMTAYDRSLPQNKVVKHQVARTKTSRAKTATAIKVAPRPLYIYVPGFTGTPASTNPDQTNSCESSMVDCSDQQLCETWGLDCATGGFQSSPAQPAAPASTSDALQIDRQLVSVVENSQSTSQTSTESSSAQDSSDDC